MIWHKYHPCGNDSGPYWYHLQRLRWDIPVASLMMLGRGRTGQGHGVVFFPIDNNAEPAGNAWEV